MNEYLQHLYWVTVGIILAVPAIDPVLRDLGLNMGAGRWLGFIAMFVVFKTRIDITRECARTLAAMEDDDNFNLHD